MLLPSLRIFLDVDDLEDIAHLEKYVADSDVVLVMLTDKYIASANCRRELIAAFELKKPIIICRETDINHGGALVAYRVWDVLRPEYAMEPKEQAVCKRLLSIAARGTEGGTIEWYREKHLKHAALNFIVQKIVDTQRLLSRIEGGSQQHLGSHGSDRLASFSDIQLDLTSHKPRHAQQHVAYVSQHYVNLHIAHGDETVPNTFDELSRRFTDVGAALSSSSSMNSITVVLLTPTIFDDDELVGEIRGLLEMPTDTRPRTIFFYSTAVPFATYISRCPPELKALGLLSFFFQKWPRSAELQRVAVAFALRAHESVLTQRRWLPDISCCWRRRESQLSRLHEVEKAGEDAVLRIERSQEGVTSSVAFHLKPSKSKRLSSDGDRTQDGRSSLSGLRVDSERVAGTGLDRARRSKAMGNKHVTPALLLSPSGKEVLGEARTSILPLTGIRPHDLAASDSSVEMSCREERDGPRQSRASISDNQQHRHSLTASRV